MRYSSFIIYPSAFYSSPCIVKTILRPPAQAAMLAEANPLPCAETEPALVDRNRKRTAEKRCLNVSGHVVGAFLLVSIRKILDSQSIQNSIQIDQHVRVGVFVDRQRCRSVLDENVQQTNVDFRQFRKRFKICCEIGWQPFGKEGS